MPEVRNFTFGIWPSKFIDHINGNKSDNRISNLREATRSENKCNQSRLSNNKSGFKGVSFINRSQNFLAQCCVNGKIKNLGYYPTAELASKAYEEFAKIAHGEFYYASSTKG